MLFVFITFMVGWTPVYILSVTSTDETKFYWIYLYIQLLPELSSFILILDLFWYNHDLRQYLKNKLLKCLHSN